MSQQNTNTTPDTREKPSSSNDRKADLKSELDRSIEQKLKEKQRARSAKEGVRTVDLSIAERVRAREEARAEIRREIEIHHQLPVEDPTKILSETEREERDKAQVEAKAKIKAELDAVGINEKDSTFDTAKDHVAATTETIFSGNLSEGQKKVVQASLIGVGVVAGLAAINWMYKKFQNTVNTTKEVASSAWGVIKWGFFALLATGGVYGAYRAFENISSLNKAKKEYDNLKKKLRMKGLSPEQKKIYEKRLSQLEKIIHNESQEIQDPVTSSTESNPEATSSNEVQKPSENQEQAEVIKTTFKKGLITQAILHLYEHDARGPLEPQINAAIETNKNKSMKDVFRCITIHDGQKDILIVPPITIEGEDRENRHIAVELLLAFCDDNRSLATRVLSEKKNISLEEAERNLQDLSLEQYISLIADNYSAIPDVLTAIHEAKDEPEKALKKLGNEWFTKNAAFNNAVKESIIEMDLTPEEVDALDMQKLFGLIINESAKNIPISNRQKKESDTIEEKIRVNIIKKMMSDNDDTAQYMLPCFQGIFPEKENTETEIQYVKKYLRERMSSGHAMRLYFYKEMIKRGNPTGLLMMQMEVLKLISDSDMSFLHLQKNKAMARIIEKTTTMSKDEMKKEWEKHNIHLPEDFYERSAHIFSVFAGHAAGAALLWQKEKYATMAMTLYEFTSNPVVDIGLGVYGSQKALKVITSRCIDAAQAKVIELGLKGQGNTKKLIDAAKSLNEPMGWRRLGRNLHIPGLQFADRFLQWKNANVILQEAKILEMRPITLVQEMLKKGESIVDILKSADLTDETSKLTALVELKRQGKTALELKNAGVNLEQLIRTGYMAKDLQSAGFSLQDIMKAISDVDDLKNAGKKIVMIEDALKMGGTILDDLKKAGVTLDELLAAGAKVDDLVKAGFTAKEVSDGIKAGRWKKLTKYVRGTVVLDVAFTGFEAWNYFWNERPKLEKKLQKERDPLQRKRIEWEIEEKGLSLGIDAIATGAAYFSPWGIGLLLANQARKSAEKSINEGTDYMLASADKELAEYSSGKLLQHIQKSSSVKNVTWGQSVSATVGGFSESAKNANTASRMEGYAAYYKQIAVLTLPPLQFTDLPIEDRELTGVDSGKILKIRMQDDYNSFVLSALAYIKEKTSGGYSDTNPALLRQAEFYALKRVIQKRAEQSGKNIQYKTPEEEMKTTERDLQNSDSISMKNITFSSQSIENFKGMGLVKILHLISHDMAATEARILSENYTNILSMKSWTSWESEETLQELARGIYAERCIAILAPFIMRVKSGETITEDDVRNIIQNLRLRLASDAPDKLTTDAIDNNPSFETEKIRAIGKKDSRLSIDGMLDILHTKSII